jgi:hypothetical protein
MIVLIWVLAAYGMSNILVYGSIFQGMRDSFRKIGDSKIPVIGDLFNFISDLLSCMMCTSTWVGFFMSLVSYSPWCEIVGLNQYLSIFFDGMLASGAVWVINAIVEWFEENRMSNQKQELTYIVKDEEGNEIING